MKHEDFQDWHESGICPVCKGYDTHYGEFHLEGNGCSYDVTCEDCGAVFKEAYNFSFIGHYDIVSKENKE